MSRSASDASRLRRSLQTGAAVLALLLAGPAAGDSHASAGETPGEQEAMPSEDAAAPAEEAPPTVPAGAVPRAQFTSGVEEREPVDRLQHVSDDRARLLFFTELRGLDGHTVTHRWEHAGEVVAEVPFEVDGPRWRVWSSKDLDEGALGTWAVTVVDESGQELVQREIDVVEASSGAEAEPMAGSDDAPAPPDEAPASPPML